MASGSPAPSNVTSGTAAVAPSAHANYIEEKLEKTGTDVQVVEVSTTILTMFVFVLVYLLTMVIIDQWLVPEGLGSGNPGLCPGVTFRVSRLLCDPEFASTSVVSR